MSRTRIPVNGNVGELDEVVAKARSILIIEPLMFNKCGGRLRRRWISLGPYIAPPDKPKSRCGSGREGVDRRLQKDS